MGEGAALRRLRRRIERLEPRSPGWLRTESEGQGEVVPTGFPALDALLPRGGLPRGQVIEWDGPRSSGKTTLLRFVLARLREAGEAVAVVDGARTLYAPDWVGSKRGLFWVVRPPDPVEAAWSADLLLRSGAFGAVALDLGAGAGRPGLRRWAGLRRGVAVRLGRLAEESGVLFVTLGEVPLAALRLRFRPGRVEPLRGVAFGPFLPALRPVWIEVGKGGGAEIPVLCPPSPASGIVPSARDRKGPR